MTLGEFRRMTAQLPDDTPLLQEPPGSVYMDDLTMAVHSVMADEDGDLMFCELGEPGATLAIVEE